MNNELWLRTPQAEIASGVSGRTLKRLMDDLFEEGVHYRRGFSSNAAITWEINGVREKLAWRGMIHRKGDELRRDLQKVGA